MGRDLRDRRLLITGASSGIGRSVAEQAVRSGARVVLTARSAETLDTLARQLGDRAMAVPADVTSPDHRRRLLDTVVERLGGLDVLINNAGVGSFGHFAEGTEAVLRRVMEVNFFAPVELIRLAIPVLTRSTQPAVVNVASMCGRRGMPAWSEYSASKFGLCGFSEALRAELVRFGIDVVLVNPGMTRSSLRTNLLRNEGRYKFADDRGMDADRVAAGVLRAVVKNRSETVLGWDARWMLWVNRFFPRLVDYLLARKVRQLWAQV
jgi:short-subunit dehydrogenase